MRAQLSIGAFPCRASLPRVDLLVYRRAGILIYPKESASRPFPKSSVYAKTAAAMYAGSTGEQIKHDIADKCQKQNLDSRTRGYM